MASLVRFGFLILFAGIWISGGVPAGLAADAVPSGETNFSDLPQTSSTNLVEPQALIQQAVEQTRREAEAVADRKVEALDQRLTLLQQSIESQQQRGLAAVQSSNRTLIAVAVALTGAALLGMGVIAVLVMRAARRLTGMTLAVASTHAFAPGQEPVALTAGDGAPANPAQLAGARFLGALEQLERRLRELEHSAPQPWVIGPNQAPGGRAELGAGKTAGNPAETAVTERPGAAPAPDAAADSSAGSRVALLLAKGQTLLTLDKPSEALACFDAVIALESQNAEALLKKGTALEKLRRMEEALEFYDRAIAADGRLTTAYLYKGSVFNHLERYEEALKCYEQALESEQKSLAG